MTKPANVLATRTLPSTAASLVGKAQTAQCFTTPTDTTPCVVWFGTVVNTEFLVQGAFLGTQTPFQNPSRELDTLPAAPTLGTWGMLALAGAYALRRVF